MEQIYQQYPNSNLSVLYSKLCFLMALLSMIFAKNNNIALDSWTVSPLTSYTKIPTGTVEVIKVVHESGEDLKSVGFLVCLQVSQDQDSASIVDGILEHIQARDEQTGQSLRMEKFHLTCSNVEHDCMLHWKVASGNGGRNQCGTSMSERL